MTSRAARRILMLPVLVALAATPLLSHDFWQVGALRPSTRDATFRNLYFCGASTQPGTGVPLCMLSAKIVAERVSRELAELPQKAIA